MSPPFLQTTGVHSPAGTGESPVKSRSSAPAHQQPKAHTCDAPHSRREGLDARGSPGILQLRISHDLALEQPGGQGGPGRRELASLPVPCR